MNSPGARDAGRGSQRQLVLHAVHPLITDIDEGSAKQPEGSDLEPTCDSSRSLTKCSASADVMAMGRGTLRGSRAQPGRCHCPAGTSTSIVLRVAAHAKRTKIRRVPLLPSLPTLMAASSFDLLWLGVPGWMSALAYQAHLAGVGTGSRDACMLPRTKIPLA